MMFAVAERVFAALIVNSVVTGLAFIAVLLRLWTRTFIKRRVGVDDLLMFGASVCPRRTRLLSRRGTFWLTTGQPISDRVDRVLRVVHNA